MLVFYLDYGGANNIHVLWVLIWGFAGCWSSLTRVWYFELDPWLFVHPGSRFWLFILILKEQRTSMSFKSSFGSLEDTRGSWLEFCILILNWICSGLWYKHDLNFGTLSAFWRCKVQPCQLSPHLGLWWRLEVPEWGLASWSWFGYGHWSFIHLYSKFWLSILIFKVQRTHMPVKLWFVAF